MFSLPYARFLSLRDIMLEVVEEEVREKYMLEAYNAWLNGAGGKRNFKQFLQYLGLTKKAKKEEKEQVKQTNEMMVKRNIANAQRILLLDRQKPKE